MPFDLTDFEPVATAPPSALDDFEVVTPSAVKSPSSASPTSSPDLSDFEEIAPTAQPWHPLRSDEKLPAVPSKEITPEDTAVVRQASADGKPIIMVNGQPTVGERLKPYQPSAGDRLVQGAESALGTTALRVGAGATRLASKVAGSNPLADNSALIAAADSLSKDATDWQQQQPTDTASKIGSGVGSAAGLIASGGLPGAMASIGLQSQAEKLSFGAALKSVPELAAYWLLGMGAGKLVGPLVEQSSPLVKALASGAAATSANMVSSAGIRAADGKPILPDAESLAQDALFGFGAHGMEAGKQAITDRASVVKMLEHAPDDALQMAASDPDFRKFSPYDPKLIDAELEKRKLAATPDGTKVEQEKSAAAIASELQPILPKLPGETQDKVRAIIAKQSSGEPLSEDERATLIQARSFASKVAQDQTAEGFTAPIESPPASKPVAATAAGSTAGIPGGSPSPKLSLFEQAKQEAAAKAVVTLGDTAASVQDVLPNAAAAAEEAAKVIAEKASSPTPKVETPATTGEAIVPSADAERTPAVEEQPTTEKAAVKPAGTHIVGPAIVGADEKAIAQGEIGTGHADLKKAEIAKGNADAADAEHMFVDDQGNLLDRKQAWDLAEKAGQIKSDTIAAQKAGTIGKELHSQNLNEITPEPSFVLPKRAEVAGDKMVSVNIEKFDASFSKDPQYIGKGQEDVVGRRKVFEDFQKTGKPIETSEVSVSPDGKVTFINGRHRYSVLRDQGLESMPVAMSEESRANAEKAGILTETPKDETPPTEPPTVEPSVAAPDQSVERVPTETPVAEQAVKPSARIPENDPRVIAGIEGESRVKAARGAVDRAEAKAQEQEKKATEDEAYLESAPSHLRGGAKHEARGSRRLADAYREDVKKAQQSLDEARKWKAPFVRQRIQAEADTAGVEGPPSKREATPQQLESASDRHEKLNAYAVENQGKEWGLDIPEGYTKKGEYYEYEASKKAAPVQPAVETPAPAPEPLKLAPHEEKFRDDVEKLLGDDTPEPSAAQKRVDAIRQDIENNQSADTAWKSRRKKDLKVAEKELAKEQTSESPAEPTPEPAAKASWQKTREEVKAEGGSLAKHSLDVKDALKKGEKVPLDVLESFKGREWADKAREKLYGQEVSDTLLARILKSLENESGTLYTDPLFIQSVGKPALRAAVKIAIEAREAGRLAVDAVNDAITYLRANVKDLDEDKARQFFDPFVNPPKEEIAPTPPTPELPKVETPEQRPTSTKNAVMDAERQARGLEPIDQPVRQAVGEVWDRASKTLEEDTDAGRKLVNETLKNPSGPISTEEEAVLLRYKVQLQNDIAKAVATAADESLSMGDRQEARLRSAALLDENNDLDMATKARGTVWGRLGRFRQQLANEDFSLAGMLQRARAANEGEALPSAREKQITDWHNEYTKLKEEFDAHVAKTEEERSKTALEATVKEMVEKKKAKEPKEDKTPKAAKAPVSKSIIDFAVSQREAALARIRARRGEGRLNALPVNDLADYGIVGASYIVEGVAGFSKWSKQMIAALGEEVKPHLRPIFKAAKEQAAEMRKAEPRDIAGERKATAEGIKTRLGEGDKITDLSRYVQKLAEQFVAEGITSRDLLVDAVHRVLKESVPEITKRQTMDAISGYGEFKQLNPDEIKTQLRDLKGQMQQVSKIEDMLAKKAPAKTGVERRSPSDEERRLLKQVNDLKRQGGFEVTDPAKQLRTTLDAIKTRLRNQIADYDYQISTGEKTVKDKTIAPSDIETQKLQVERDAKKAEFDSIFGKPEMTDQQRIAIATKSLEMSIADYEKKIESAKKGEFSKTEQGKTPQTDAIKSLQSRRDALRAELDSLKESDIALQESQKEATLKDAITKLQDKIDKGDISTAAKESTADTEAVAKLREQRAKLIEQILEKRKEQRLRDNPPRTEDEKRLDALEKRRDALQKKVADNDVSTKAGRQGAPTEEQAKVQGEINVLNKQIGEMRKGSAADQEQAKLDALNESIRDVENKIAKGDVAPKPKDQSVPSREVTEAKANLEELRKQLNEMRRGPKKTPDEIALAAYKTRTANRIAEMEEKIATGDFAPRPKPAPVKLDSEGATLQKKMEGIKLEYDRANVKDKLERLSKSEKLLDWLPKVSRAFLLSNPVTLAKLTAAATWRMLLTPTEEGVGSGLSRLPFVSQIAEQAPRHGGGFNVRAEAKAMAGATMKSIRDAVDIWKTGESEIDRVGGHRNVMPREWIEFFGTLHGILKTAPKRAEFERSLQKRIEFNMRRGVDVSDPLVMTRLQYEAAQDAKASIFQQDNLMVQKYNRFLRSLEEKDKDTGRANLGAKSLQSAMKTLAPIVKVPTNIVSEAFEYVAGSALGSTKMIRAFREGIDTLKPEEADIIMRQLKKGSLGAAVITLGFLAPQMIGGYYQQGSHRDPKDVKAGTLRIYGKEIPPWLLHAPAVEMLQFGSTIRRVADSKLRKGDRTTRGLGMGALAAGLGLVEEVPFVRETTDVSRIFNTNERGQFLGELARSRLEPQLIQWIAQQTDRRNGEPVARHPDSMGEYMESGIPGLRQKVPEKRKKHFSALSR